MTPYYQDSLVTIYHGDCRDVLPGLGFDVICSDPPYGMAYEHGARKGGIRLGMDCRSIIGDEAAFGPVAPGDGGATGHSVGTSQPRDGGKLSA